jgi:hypothetical protein
MRAGGLMRSLFVLTLVLIVAGLTCAFVFGALGQ